MAKILKLNSISPLAEGVFKGYEYSENVDNPDGIMVRSAQMKDYKTGKNLLAVARAGAGTNNIPSADYAEKGIVVFNTPGANANAVKELVLCEFFLGARDIVGGIEWVETLKGKEDISKLVEKNKSGFSGREILGKTLGVIGLGAIGAAVANAAASLGMNVLGADPFLSPETAAELMPAVKVVNSNDEIFAEADFITVHVPLTADTKGMFNTQTIAKMKDGAVIINNSRGELADANAVARALQSGKLSRYITDFPEERLIGVKNAVCVPHLGASTEEAEDNCAVMAARQLKDYIENGNIKNGVNYPSLSLPRSGEKRLCVHHRNIKEVLSGILALVSGEGINVENMLDKSKGEYAYLICDLSSAPSPACLEKIERINGVLRIRVI